MRITAHLRTTCCGLDMVWVAFSPEPPAHIYECPGCRRRQLLRVARPSPRYL